MSGRRSAARASMTPTSAEVIDTYRERARLPKQREIAALIARDIDRWAIAGQPDTGEHCLAIASVVFDKRHGFDFDEAGVTVAIVVALDAFCQPADLVAFSFRDPRIASWWGAASMLGRQHVLGHRLDTALNVYPTGLAWLRGNRDGIVIVSPAKAARELWDGGPYRAADVQHGRALEKLLRPPAPRVVVAVPDKLMVAA